MLHEKSQVSILLEVDLSVCPESYYYNYCHHHTPPRLLSPHSPTTATNTPFRYCHHIHQLMPPETGPDSISKFRLKHLGPQGIQALTNISNYTYTHCLIPNIWKQGRIITILKPNKDLTTPSSYRPITLLCTPSKITERLILTEHNLP